MLSNRISQNLLAFIAGVIGLSFSDIPAQLLHLTVSQYMRCHINTVHAIGVSLTVPQ